ncbi:MAG: hypothetical protein IT566_09030 [Rhodospirillaceae bacterium]|nr:hypothetical protein [Rhodospirillaceae bacterium]
MYTEIFSSASHWLFANAAPPRTEIPRAPVSRTPAMIATMWTIGGPQGMSVDSAKQALGIKPGPEDLVVYTQYKACGGSYHVPHLISCQPYRP